MVISREILLKFPYEEKQNMHNHPDHQLAEIADICLSEEDGADATQKLCQRLLEGFREHRIYSFHYPRLLGRLAQIQPYVFLDTFIGKDEYMFDGMTFNDLRRADSPVNQIPESIILDWCEQDAETRYPLIVASMQTYVKSEGSDELRWHPIVLTIIEKSPNIQAVLSQLANEIYPMSWSGSQADAMARRFSLFAQLFEHPSSEIRNWAVAQNQKLQLTVEEQHERELKENQARFERFE